MKKISKAAFLSALVMPGLGHYLLKRYISGTIFFGGSALLLFFILSTVIKRVQMIRDEMLRSGIQLDLTSVAQFLSQYRASTDNGFLEYAAIALVVIWAVALVDICRLSR